MQRGAGVRRRASGLGLSLVGLALAGCASETELVGARLEPRFELAGRPRVALLAPVLDDPQVWAYGEPRAAVAAVATSYRAGSAPYVLPLRDAPRPLGELLEQTRAALAARGYRLAQPGQEPELYVSLGISREEGRVVQLGLYVGGAHEGRFLPRALALVVSPADPRGALDPRAELEELLEVLPPASPP